MVIGMPLFQKYVTNHVTLCVCDVVPQNLPLLCIAFWQSWSGQASGGSRWKRTYQNGRRGGEMTIFANEEDNHYAWLLTLYNKIYTILKVWLGTKCSYTHWVFCIYCRTRKLMWSLKTTWPLLRSWSISGASSDSLPTTLTGLLSSGMAHSGFEV
jgi:hypothetical protein